MFIIDAMQYFVRLRRSRMWLQLLCYKHLTLPGSYQYYDVVFLKPILNLLKPGSFFS